MWHYDVFNFKYFKMFVNIVQLWAVVHFFVVVGVGGGVLLLLLCLV